MINFVETAASAKSDQPVLRNHETATTSTVPSLNMQTALDRSLAQMNAVALTINNDEMDGIGRISSNDQPILTPPKQPINQLISPENLVRELNEIIQETSLQDIKSRVAQLEELKQAEERLAHALSNKLDDDLMVLEKEATKFEQIKQQLLPMQSELRKQKEQLLYIQTDIQQTEKQIQSLTAADADNPLPTDLTQATLRLTELQQQFISATNLVASLQTDYDRISTNVANELLSAINNVSTSIDANLKFISATPHSGYGSTTTPSIKNDVVQKTRNSSILVTKVLMELQELIQDNSDSMLDTNIKLSRSLQEFNLAESIRITKEEEASAKKADELNKVMGCVGQIVAGLAIVGGVVGALFSGGASLAIAAVGIALLIADTVLEATGQQSISSRIFEPLMNAIVKPMIDALMNAIVDALVKGGMEESQAATNAIYILAPLLIVMVVATAIIGKAVANSQCFVKQVVANVIAKITEAIKKAASVTAKKLTELTPNLLKNGMSFVANESAILHQAALKKIGLTAEKAGVYAIRTNFGTTVVSTFGVGLQSGLGVASATYKANSYNKQGEITKLRTDLNIIKQQIEDAVTRYSSSIRLPQELATKASEMLHSQFKAQRFILSHRSA